MGSAQLTKIMISSSSITSASSRAMFAIRSSFSYNNIPRNYSQLRVLTSKPSSVLLCNNNIHNHLRRQGGTSGKPSSSYISLPSLITPRSLCCSATTNDEETSAKAAAASADTEEPTIFDRIIAKEIPSTIVYEDDKVLAFRDINPQAPVHVLVIPKFRDSLTKLAKAEPRHNEILGYLLYAAKIVAEKEGILEGFRVVINNGPSACQSVYHLHLHVLGGRQMKWPAG